MPISKNVPSVPEPIIIGLTGGIGSGKSTVAAIFRSRGITVINLDDVGRELLTSSPAVISGIIKLLGDTVKQDHGLDRNKMRELLFSHPESRQAVEAFLHPLILETFRERCTSSVTKGNRLVVCEAALLIEAGYQRLVSSLIVVIAPTSIRKARLMARDKVSDALAENMIAAQTTDAERLRQADVVIHNDSDAKHLEQQVEIVLQDWKQKGWCESIPTSRP